MRSTNWSAFVVVASIPHPWWHSVIQFFALRKSTIFLSSKLPTNTLALDLILRQRENFPLFLAADWRFTTVTMKAPRSPPNERRKKIYIHNKREMHRMLWRCNNNEIYSLARSCRRHRRAAILYFLIFSTFSRFSCIRLGFFLAIFHSAAGCLRHFLAFRC